MSQIVSYKVEKLASTCYYLETWSFSYRTLETVTNNQLNAHLIFPNNHKSVFWITEEENHKVSALPTLNANTLIAHKLKLAHAYIHLFTYSPSSVSLIGLHIPYSMS